MPTAECTEKMTGQAALLDFYGFHEQPFGVTPDPRFLYLTGSHREALASLVYAIETKRGFSALVAEPGMGKTSLLFSLLDKLKPSARTAFLFRPDSNAKELLQSLLIDLGLGGVSQDTPQMHDALNAVLLEDLRAGKKFVWVIDEAQDLEYEVLEAIRLLSNFETPVSKLMHIVLSGQPALSEKLARPELLQLRQRVSTFVRLDPLSSAETSFYIQHRARRAGCRNKELFTTQSRDHIFEASHGIPRNINNLCFSCLSVGFVQHCKEITPDIVREVLADHELEAPPQPVTEPSSPSPSLAQGFVDLPVIEPGPLPKLPSRWGTRLAVLGFLVVPFLLIGLESSSRGRVLEALSGPLGAQIVHGLTGYNVDMPDPPGAGARALRPPMPPANMIVRQENVPEVHSDLSGRAPEQAEEDDRRPVYPKLRDGKRAGNVVRQTSRVIYARGGETLTTLASRYYGESNGVILAQIRRHNPQIKDAITVFKRGQPIVLPDLAPQYPWKGNFGHASH